MNRPEIHEFFPKGTTLKDAHELYKKSPELFRYITAIDAYIDFLEKEIQGGCNPYKRYLLFVIEPYVKEGGLAQVKAQYDSIDQFLVCLIGLQLNSDHECYLWDRLSGEKAWYPIHQPDVE